MRFALAALVLTPIIAADPAFESEILSWRKDREARLKAPDGWLSLAGLFWLKVGRTEVGSSPSAKIRLPKRAPADAGWFSLEGEQVSFQAAPGATVTINGKQQTTARLRDDKDGTPDIVDIAGLKLYAIRRGTRLGIRLKDEQSEYRKNFQGLQWYPPRREWLIRARLAPYPQPRKMLFNSQTGDKQEYTSPGYVEFEVAGRKHRLTPVNDGGKLFFIFRDKTAGKTTYPAARYLYSELPVNGRVTLDFNKAYNPPCVFTPFATCPLPPPENRLPIEINAGELMYKGKH